MIDKANISHLGYNYPHNIMTVYLKEEMIIKGFNRKEVKIRCSYDKFKEYVSKFLYEFKK